MRSSKNFFIFFRIFGRQSFKRRAFGKRSGKKNNRSFIDENIHRRKFLATKRFQIGDVPLPVGKRKPSTDRANFSAPFPFSKAGSSRAVPNFEKIVFERFNFYKTIYPPRNGSTSESNFWIVDGKKGTRWPISLKKKRNFGPSLHGEIDRLVVFLAIELQLCQSETSFEMLLCAWIVLQVWNKIYRFLFVIHLKNFERFLFVFREYLYVNISFSWFTKIIWKYGNLW